MIKLNTIGFTQKSAEQFFSLLRESQTRLLIDVRINNRSQLAGFAKQNDLKYFLKELCDIDYVHMTELAPTAELLKRYQHKEMPWQAYQNAFLDLMAKRQIERLASKELLNNACLLCSEHKPHFCHRRLVAEYFMAHTDLKLEVRHLY